QPGSLFDAGRRGCAGRRAPGSCVVDATAPTMRTLPSPAANPRSSPMLTPDSHLNRRSILGLTAGAAAIGGPFGLPIAAPAAEEPARPAKRYKMLKSINLWAFPYPQKMSLEQCLRLAKDAGFD